MIFKAIKLCILTVILLVVFVNLKSNRYYKTYGLMAPNVLSKNYYNEADREENEVHHHFEYPESSWKQQHRAPKIVIDESAIALNTGKVESSKINK